MDASRPDLLPSRDTLLAAGASLIFVGIVLRGFARSNRREIALRKQHLLLSRKPGDAEKTDLSVPTATHWEKYLPRYAAAAIAAGFVILTIALFR